LNEENRQDMYEDCICTFSPKPWSIEYNPNVQQLWNIYRILILQAMDDKCINCDLELTGIYCSNCGQKGEIERITSKSLFSNYVGRIFGFDTKFLRTIKDLTISPGVVGHSFIDGNRVRYIDPVGYFFIITTLMLLTYAVLDVDIQEFMFSNSNQFSEMAGQETPTERQQKFQQETFQILSDNMRLLGFLIIPFIAITGKLFYRKSGLNFLEHSTHAFYIQGHATILTILAIVLFKFTGINVNMYVTVLYMPYFAWAALGFYHKKGFWQWIKGMLFYIVSTILFMIGFMVIGGAFIIIYIKFIDPRFLG
jgi:hypothetical protein